MESSSTTAAAKSSIAQLVTGGLLWSLVASVAWVSLVTWKLSDVPGLEMDEAWSIVAARGQYKPSDPLSGMTRYSGPFPVLLLELAGTRWGLEVLRGASVLCNGLAVVLLLRILQRLYPAHSLRGWAVPLIATLPIWLVYVRNGIEIAMFGPLLAVLGLYLLLLRTRRSGFAAGLCWGLLAYNHALGAFVPLSFAFAWLVVYGLRVPPIPYVPALLGFALGLAPRAAALVFFDVPFEGSATMYAAGPAWLDLANLPGALWDCLNGRLVYMGVVGHEAVKVWPYWLLAAGLLVPWLRKARAVPREAWLTLVASITLAVLGTVATPSIAVRYLLCPLIGFAFFLVQLGASAIASEPRWSRLVQGTACAIVAGNLFYMLCNFYLPWQRNDLVVARYNIGTRNTSESSISFLPKGELVRRLIAMGTKQVITSPSIERPLRVLLDKTEIQVSLTEKASNVRPSVLVRYHEGSHKRRCVETTEGKMCFANPTTVDNQYLVYEQH